MSKRSGWKLASRIVRGKASSSSNHSRRSPACPPDPLPRTFSSSWWLRVGVFAYPSLSARDPRSHHFSFSPIRNLQLRLGQFPVSSMYSHEDSGDAVSERRWTSWFGAPVSNGTEFERHANGDPWLPLGLTPGVLIDAVGTAESDSGLIEATTGFTAMGLSLGAGCHWALLAGRGGGETS